MSNVDFNVSVQFSHFDLDLVDALSFVAILFWSCCIIPKNARSFLSWSEVIDNDRFLPPCRSLGDGIFLVVVVVVLRRLLWSVALLIDCFVLVCFVVLVIVWIWK